MSRAEALLSSAFACLFQLEDLRPVQLLPETLKLSFPQPDSLLSILSRPYISSAIEGSYTFFMTPYPATSQKDNFDIFISHIQPVFKEEKND